MVWGHPYPLDFHVKVGRLKKGDPPPTLRLRFPAGIFGRPFDMEVIRSALRHVHVEAPANCRPDLDVDGWFEEMGPADLVLKLPPSCSSGDIIETAISLPPVYIEGETKLEVLIESGARKGRLAEIALHSKRLRPSDADGQGSFKLDYDRPIIAGTPANWSLTYTAGPDGISPGGCLSVVLPHPLYNIRPPTVVPGITAPLDNVKVRWQGTGISSLISLLSMKNERVFHSSLDITLEKGSLPPGNKITITFRESTFYISGKWPPGVWIDGDGDGAFAKVDQGDFLEVSPAGEKINRALFLSPNMKRPQAIIKDHVTDRFGNPASPPKSLKRTFSYPAWISTKQKNGDWKLNFLLGERNGKSLNYEVHIAGSFSQPQILWGDLHGHTMLSDGAGTPENYFHFARDVSMLDFAAITDHTIELKEAEWERILDAAEKSTEQDRFVAIPGIEINLTGGGHTNLYFARRASLPPPTFGEDDDIFTADYNGQDLFIHFPTPASIGSFLNGIDAIAAFHRAGSSGPIRQVATGQKQPVIEIYSNLGCAEERGKPWSISEHSDDETVMDILARGVKVGFIGASDSHDGRPGMSLWGRFPNGLTALKAEQLSLEGILDTLRKRRTWVTIGARGYMEFRINDKPEGSELVTSDRNMKIRVVVALPGAREVSIRRFANGNWSDFAVPAVDGLPVPFWDYESTAAIEPGKSIYYIRVMGDSFPVAWSSPIWVEAK